MSPRTPTLSEQQVATVLGRAGLVAVSQRGTHLKLRHADGRTAIVSMHPTMS